MAGFDPNAYGRPPRKTKQASSKTSTAQPYSLPEWTDSSIDATQSTKGTSATPFLLSHESQRKTESSSIGGEASSAQLSQNSLKSPGLGESRFAPGKTHKTLRPPASRSKTVTAPAVQPSTRIERPEVVQKANTVRSYPTTQSSEVGELNQASPPVGNPTQLKVARKPAKMPSISKQNDPFDNGNRLLLLQEVAMQQISRKEESRKRDKDYLNTTSLKDLDLARAPINPRRPAASQRTWAPESAAASGREDERWGAQVPAKEDESHITQVPTSQVPMPGSAATLPAQEAMPTELEAGTPHKATALIPSKPSGRIKWATKDEMKDEPMERDSNAWGSAAPSDATRESKGSVKSFGKMLNKRGAVPDDQQGLSFDWEGNLMPAPAEWNERPRYNNNNPTFKAFFKDWQEDVYKGAIQRQRFSNGVQCYRMPTDVLENTDYHPDGMSMVPRGHFIHLQNAVAYGYTDDPEDATKYAQPTAAGDFSKWDKLDLNDYENRKIRHETTEDLVSNWLKHLDISRNASIEAGMPIEDDKVYPRHEQDFEPKPVAEVKKYRPRLNIYLRPATERDRDELARIYNEHIAHGVGPSEIDQIGAGDMDYRMSAVAGGKYPFIVAVKKSQKTARDVQTTEDEEFSWRTGLPVTHKTRITLTRVETLAGFCCVNDVTAADFVEHISAEIELYVDPECKRMGVAKCLLDKMLEMVDRGYRRTTECAFHCDAVIRHQYGSGGRRDVHKVWFMLRKWHFPKPATIQLDKSRRYRKSAFTKTTEDDYSQWLKAWLESLGFEEEACLKKFAAKHGRYLDMVYLGRETSWQPAEGQIPGPDPSHRVNNVGIEDSD